MLNNLQREGVITDADSLSSLAGISSDPVAFFVSTVSRMDSTSYSVRKTSLKIGPPTSSDCSRGRFSDVNTDAKYLLMKDAISPGTEAVILNFSSD